MGVKKRNPWFAIVVTFITLGIYGIYWFYQTSKEMIRLYKSDSSPVLWTIGLFIPFVNIYVIWKYSELGGKVTKRENILIFLLWVVFFPVDMYLIQEGLNKHATE